MKIRHLQGMFFASRAVEDGVGIGVLPDNLNEPESGLVQLMMHVVMPTVDCDFVFPEAMNNVARVGVVRDFLGASAQRWLY